MSDLESSGSGVPWETVEFASMAVLLSTLVLAIGGFASGIAVSLNLRQASTAVEVGAQWAEPVLGMILLGLVGLSCRRYEDWVPLGSAGPRTPEGLVHLARCRTIGNWAQLGLVLVAAGSASTFGAVVASGFGLAPGVLNVWSQAVLAGTALLAVLVLVGAGLLLGRKLREPGPGDQR